MPLTVPPELKKITPFVRRAEELDRDTSNPESRLVAFYCRQYAVHVGIPLATSAQGKQCLGELLENLEGEKAAMSNFTRDESKYLCKTFCNKIFDKADVEDRMGMASKTTARTFYAAATFLEMLQQFFEEDEVSEEREEVSRRIKYAKWKATDILKAIKEGREPTPGGYGEEEEEEEEEAPASNGQARDDDILPPVLPPPVPPVVETVEEDEDDEEDVKSEEDVGNDEGTEVGLDFGPPPAYPGVTPPDDTPPLPPPAAVDRPPIAPVPAPAPAPKLSSNKQRSGLFGIGKKKTNPPSKVSKAALADAVELTSFALAALQNKDAELGATRLKQALEALGR